MISNKTIDQDVQVKKQQIIKEDLSMFIRLILTKHRRGVLDEEYCQIAIDNLQRKGLQGSVLRGN